MDRRNFLGFLTRASVSAATLATGWPLTLLANKAVVPNERALADFSGLDCLDMQIVVEVRPNGKTQEEEETLRVYVGLDDNEMGNNSYAAYIIRSPTNPSIATFSIGNVMGGIMPARFKVYVTCEEGNTIDAEDVNLASYSLAVNESFMEYSNER